MNIQEQNVPQSYRDLLATIPEKSNFFYEYARRKKPTLPKRVYVIQGELYGIYLLSSCILTAENSFFYLLSSSGIGGFWSIHHNDLLIFSFADYF